MVVKPVPGQTDDTYIALNRWAGENFIVPSDAANVTGGMEYMRCMLSKANAQYFAREVSAIMPVVGGTEGVELSAALSSAISALDGAGDMAFNTRYRSWYSDLSTEVSNNMGELMTGRISAEEFCETVQGIADDVKADDDIPKYSREA